MTKRPVGRPRAGYLTRPRRERALAAGAVFVPAKEQARRRLASGGWGRPLP